jgi:hypothetical protein
VLKSLVVDRLVDLATSIRWSKLILCIKRPISSQNRERGKGVGKPKSRATHDDAQPHEYSQLSTRRYFTRLGVR